MENIKALPTKHRGAIEFGRKGGIHTSAGLRRDSRLRERTTYQAHVVSLRCREQCPIVPVLRQLLEYNRRRACHLDERHFVVVLLHRDAAALARGLCVAQPLLKQHALFREAFFCYLGELRDGPRRARGAMGDGHAGH
jgi:hypothetical protein